MNNLKNAAATKRIAIAATDNKRADLIEWSYFNKDLLVQHLLTAVGETGLVLEGTLNISVNKLFTADTGGYQQLAGLIENGKIEKEKRTKWVRANWSQHLDTENDIG